MKKKNPRHQSFLNTLFHCWVVPTLLRGRKTELTQEDFRLTGTSDLSSTLGQQLLVHWQKQLKQGQPSLWRALNQAFGRRFVWISVLLLIEQGSRLAAPVLLGLLIRGVEAQDLTGNRLWIPIAYVLSNFVDSIIKHYYYFTIHRLGMNIRVAITNLVYDKILTLEIKTVASTGIGRFTNVLSNDVNRFDSILRNIPAVLISPILLVVIAGILWNYTGVSCFAGLIVLGLLGPIQGYTAKKLGVIRSKLAAITDQRIRVLVEMVDGIQWIKMSAWEELYWLKITEIRRKELESIASKNRYLSFNYSIFDYMTKFAVLANLLVFVLLGSEPLTVEVIFVTLAMYNTIGVFFGMSLPNGIAGLSETYVSVKRIKNIMLEVSISPSQISFQGVNSGRGTVELKNVHASWTEKTKTLVGISLRARPGDRVGIIGPIGAGKSALLQVILGDLRAEVPEAVLVTGTIAYACQEPWIFADSVRNNILFGRKFEAGWYNEVVAACNFQPDFFQFAFGDETLVGENGVALSGGQKARLNLARAVYSKADIYLLDDPLSALDVNVGRHVLQNCLCGLLKDKTVLMVTHQPAVLRDWATEVISLNSGRIASRGSVENVLGIDDAEERTTYTMDDIEAVTKEFGADSAKPYELGYGTFAAQSKPAELVRVGGLGWRTLLNYVRSGNSWGYLALVAFILVLAQFLISGSDYVLKTWSDQKPMRSTPANNFNDTSSDSGSTNLYPTFLEVYAGMIGALIIVSYLKVFNVFNVILISAKKLNENLLSSVVRAPVSFFEETKGLILKLFSTDTGVADETLTHFLYISILTFLQVAGALAVLLVLGNWLLLPLFFYLFGTYCILKIYVRPAAVMKRVESLALSPVLEHLSNTVSGLSVIRGSKAEGFFRSRFAGLQDAHTAVFYTYLSSMQWAQLTTELIADAFVAVVLIYFLAASASSSTLGLGLTEAMILMTEGTATIRNTTQVLNYIVSVERLIDYAQIEPEGTQAGLRQSGLGRCSRWPYRGNIRIDDMVVTYKNGHDVLQGITCNIKEGEKVGIIGRTGAGKSTLVSSLLRIIESRQGQIHIDGVDISRLDLKTLRRNISIIPQNPVLMTGSLRINLDPFSEFQDSDLWNALNLVKLESRVRGSGQGLELEVTAAGSNFSQGERQLVSLARTILRSCKIVILDEATANVDMTTDALIQSVIQERLKDSTVLTIAHRLDTVMSSDRILVLDSGRVKEFDSPRNLLRSKSYLYQLLEKTGNLQKFIELAN